MNQYLHFITSDVTFEFMYKVSVNKKSFEIESEDEGFRLNDLLIQWDIQQIDEGYFHILYDNKSYTAELVNADPVTKAFKIKINGRFYTVDVKDRFDVLLEKMGMNSGSTSKVNNIKAPMPGLIIELKVGAGDSVTQGDILLILEAMKMENIIKSPGTGVVKTVKVKKGDSVEKNQILLEF